MRKLMDTERKVKSNTGTQGVWILSPHIWPLLYSASYFVPISDDADDQAQPKTGFYIQSPITLDIWVAVQGYICDTVIPFAMNMNLFGLQNLVIHSESL